MRKEDLKNGMFVVMEDGTSWFVFKNEIIDVLVSPHDERNNVGLVTINFQDISDDLKVKFEGTDRLYSIEKIYMPPNIISMNADVWIRAVLRCKFSAIDTIPPMWERGKSIKEKAFENMKPMNGCHVSRDGEVCDHPMCPQHRDNEPETSGRSCPLLKEEEED